VEVLDPPQRIAYERERPQSYATCRAGIRLPPLAAPVSMVNKVLRKTSLRFYGLFPILAVLLAVLAAPAGAQGVDDVRVPYFFDPDERLPLPDLGDRRRVRFLTTTDFPPFNFLDQSGRLAGFHIDLVRGICAELDIEPICQIQALPFAELEAAMEAGAGEAVVAGIAVTAESRERLRFSRPYLALPARFIVPKPDGSASLSILPQEAADTLAGKRVAVVEGSAHDAMLRAYFPEIVAAPFTELRLALQAVKDKRVAAVFGDGVQLSFWLDSETAADCCTFLDGPFLSATHLGQGLAVAAPLDDAALVGAIDHALAAMSRNGRLAEIYLRYFPNGLF
jgi:polar amino acid transport system substrate-binding protein